MAWWWLVLGCSGGGEAPAGGVAPVEAPLVQGAPEGAALATYREMWADRQAPRSAADGAGQFVRVGEGSVTVTERHTFELRYIAGPEGVAVGGALTFVPEPFWGWSAPQTHAPGAPGFVEVQAPPGVQLVARAHQGQLVLEVAERPLEPGSTVRLVYSGRVDRFAEDEAGLFLGVDGDGDGVRAWVRPTPRVRVVAGPATQLVATLPTTTDVGAPMRLTVAALDAFGNAGAVGVDSVEVVRPRGWQGPDRIDLTDGLGEASVTASEEGIGRVVVRSEGMATEAGPVIARNEAPRILWADLQIHTGRSDGTGTPAAAYRYARDVAGLDVAAVTDHDRFGMSYLDADDALWREARQAADAATKDGWVAFPAYEWTNWVFGHRHVLYVGDPGPVYSSLDPATDTPQELWDALRRHDAITVAHHPAGGPVPIDWTIAPDPWLEPVVEVTSVHGQSESPSLPQSIHRPVAASFVERPLQAGVRLGLIGSTDGHDGHPGLAHLHGGRGGLTAVIDAEPTRQGVAEALRARRVYATNGVRSFLRFDADGQPMGSVLPPGSARLELRAVATAPITEVQLVGRDGVVERIAGTGAVLHQTWTVPGTAGELYYVRVLQEDGGMLWSSPIWFDAAAKPPGGPVRSEGLTPP